MPFDSQQRVTIVMTARERYGLTLDAIDGIRQHTPGPYRLIFVDAQAPDSLRQALAPYQARGELEVLRSDDALWPHLARRKVMPGVSSEYVVFIDNDVLVSPGWLEALVGCADETGAGIVGPLYLIGGGAEPARVHMAGGKITRQEVEGGCVLEEAHVLANTDPAVVVPGLKRQRCDFVEFHCMLVRTALLEDGALLDPEIHCVHEHIDLSLALEARGAATWFEPASVVDYQAFAPFALPDLPLYRARWSIAAAEHSIATFCAKWGVLDDKRSFGNVRDFVRIHNAQLDPMRPNHPPQSDRDQPMRAEELCQTRSALLDLAVSRGYRESELSQFVQAYGLAQVLMDGGYRPCGRPFINHLTGTASVMIRYGFRHELVVAALLHAFYTHCPPHVAGVDAAYATVRGMLGGEGSPIEHRVRAYTRRDMGSGPALPPSIAELSLLDAEVLMLTAANEIDMHLSGELRYSGRTDALAPEWMAPMSQVCSLIGVPGMVETLERARADVVPAPLLTRRGVSYRIGPDRRSAVSMLSGVPRLLRDA